MNGLHIGAFVIAYGEVKLYVFSLSLFLSFSLSFLFLLLTAFTFCVTISPQKKKEICFPLSQKKVHKCT